MFKETSRKRQSASPTTVQNPIRIVNAFFRASAFFRRFGAPARLSGTPSVRGGRKKCAFFSVVFPLQKNPKKFDFHLARTPDLLYDLEKREQRVLPVLFDCGFPVFLRVFRPVFADPREMGRRTEIRRFPSFVFSSRYADNCNPFLHRAWYNVLPPSASRSSFDTHLLRFWLSETNTGVACAFLHPHSAVFAMGNCEPVPHGGIGTGFCNAFRIHTALADCRLPAGTSPDFSGSRPHRQHPQKKG